MLLGENESGLSTSTITRLVAAWSEERATWKTRSLANLDYVSRLAFKRWTGSVGSECSLDDRRRGGAGHTLELALAKPEDREGETKSTAHELSRTISGAGVLRSSVG
jgi:hypothetical protein